MDFDPPLVEARLQQRYKRFLADVQLPDGSLLTAHCPNTGAMTGCMDADSRVWLQPSSNPRRKLSATWEVVETADGDLACIHSSRANALVEEALDGGLLEPLCGYTQLRREVRYGSEKSRVDFLLQFADGPCYVEVKSVTLAGPAKTGMFPDAVSARGTRHLRELIAMRQDGARAVLCFVVMHNGIESVRPADHIDPLYGETLREAQRAGVEIIACRALVGVENIAVTSMLSVDTRRFPAG